MSGETFPAAVRAYVDDQWRTVLVMTEGRKWATLFHFATFKTYRISIRELSGLDPVAVRPGKVRASIRRRMRAIRRQRRFTADPGDPPPQFPMQMINRVLGGKP